jgi:hypothetical protein
MVREYRHYTHDERVAYLKEFDASGKSLRKFCEHIELNQWTLHTWIKARRQQTGVFAPDQVDEPQFVNLSFPKAGVGLQGSSAKSEKESALIVLQRGPWSITVPRNVQGQDLEQVIRALEAADAV